MTVKQTKARPKAEGGRSGRPPTRRRVLKGGFALGAGLAAGSFGIIGKARAAPIVMRFGSDSPVRSSHTKSAVVMKELVESRTSGRVEVTIYPDGQLGGNGPMMNSVKTGSLDAVVADMSNISTAVPEADVFNLPFLFKDVEQVLRFADGPAGARLKPLISEAFRCEVLGFASNGMNNMFNGKRPIRTPADIVGLKMAVGVSKIQRDTILAFEGIPTVMGLTAVYTALQTGLVDGCAKTPDDMVELKFYQVTKYLTRTKHYSMPNALIVSKRFMDKLGPQDQAIVREAGQPAVEAHVKEVLKGEEAALAFLQEKGIQFFAMEDPRAFADKVEPVYQEAAGRVGADLIAMARKFAET